MLVKSVPYYVIMLIVALPQLSETIYTPSLPSIADALKTTDNLAEQTLTIYLLGFAFGVLLWGIFSDRFGRKPGLYWGLFIYGMACLGCFFSKTIEMLMVMRFLQAFGASTGSVLGQAIARDSIPLQERGKAFSNISMALSLAPAIGPIIGGVIDDAFGWSYVFISLIVIASIIAGLIHFNLPETHIAKINNKEIIPVIKKCLGQMIKDNRLIGFSFLIGAVNGILFGYFAEAPFFFIEILGIPTKWFGILSFYIVFPLAIGGLISRKLNKDGMTQNTVIHIGIQSIAIGSLCFYGLSHFQLVGATKLLMVPISLLCICIVMVGVTLIIPNALGQALENYKETAGTAASLFGFFYYVLISFFTSLMGIFHNGTLHRLPLFFLCMSMVLFISFKWLIHKNMRTKNTD
jgi:Bcr/CflA subfamily drug resistance transporter